MLEDGGERKRKKEERRRDETESEVKPMTNGAVEGRQELWQEGAPGSRRGQHCRQFAACFICLPSQLASPPRGNVHITST